MAANDYWSGFLTDNPDILYQGMLPKTGSQNFLNYWMGQSGNQYNKYLGSLGRQALGGVAPSGSFYDYLQQNPFQTQWAQMMPWQRGEKMAGRARWNVPW